MWLQKSIKMASVLQIFVVPENNAQRKERLEKYVGLKKGRAREKLNVLFPP